MLFYMGILCTLLTSTLVYPSQTLEITAIQTDSEEEEDDYSSLDADLKLLDEEDMLHN